MKRLLLLFTIPTLFLISCNGNKSSKQLLLATQNLKSVLIALHADSAYNLKTPKGAIIKIAKNSFDVRAGATINLEIKEAYSAGDILLAGLTTKSNGELLQSGGMIYVNATADEKAVKIIKPINISIPSEVYDERMQLFKGEIENDGDINWVDPQPLDTAPAAKMILNGRVLFKSNCASCHKPTMDFTAPALAGCREREPDRDWAYRYTKNPALMTQTDAYAKALYQKWNKIQMTAFLALRRDEVNAILDYCDNEARLNPFSRPANTTALSDSLGQITTICSDTQFLPLPDSNFKQLPIGIVPDSSATIYPGMRFPELPMYQFNIDQSGWYNIDCFIDDNQALVTNVTLTATLNYPKGLYITVYLCVPDRKLLTSGDEMKNSKYQFYNTEGSIPLILNDEAIIFAYGSDTAHAWYGISRFTVKEKQDIAVNLKASTKEDILNALKSNKLDGIKIEIEKPVTYTTEYGFPGSFYLDTSKSNMQMQIFDIPCNLPDSPRQISAVKK